MERMVAALKAQREHCAEIMPVVAIPDLPGNDALKSAYDYLKIRGINVVGSCETSTYAKRTTVCGLYAITDRCSCSDPCPTRPLPLQNPAALTPDLTCAQWENVWHLSAH